MKGTLYTIEGKEKGHIEMPKFFADRIRADIVAKYFEADKMIQPYAHGLMSGKKHSASGTISHKRHDWKGHYGRGISRLPRKTMSRRGVNFNWVGAEVSGTRGGRRSHGPKGIGKEKKINKKEVIIAMNSAIAATGNANFIVERYGRLDKFDIKTPIVIESKFDGIKTKDMIKLLKHIFGKTIFDLVMKKKEVRAGRGKLRGRKYKSNAGLLLVKGKDENLRMTGIEIKNSEDISISDFYPLGRLTVYTEKAVEELKK